MKIKDANVVEAEKARKDIFEKLDATNHATISRQYLAKAFLRPAIELGLVSIPRNTQE